MRRVVGFAAAAMLVLTACTDSSQPDSGVPQLPRVQAPDIEVDTPPLRRAKERAGVEDCVPGQQAAVDGGLPELSLPCFGGGPDVDLATLEGPRVVNLWAGWCKPCREEMPLLQEFHERYGDRVPVLGVNWQDVQTEAAMDLVVETGVTYPLVADPGNELSGKGPLPNLRGLPFFILVDADSEVAHMDYVSIKSVEELVELVEEHLEVTL